MAIPLQYNTRTPLEATVRDYIAEFDKAFTRDDLAECNRIEITYDQRLASQGVDAAVLHEYLCLTEVGTPIADCIKAYRERR